MSALQYSQTVWLTIELAIELALSAVLISAAVRDLRWVYE
jgi:hypothetical protein